MQYKHSFQLNEDDVSYCNIPKQVPENDPWNSTSPRSLRQAEPQVMDWIKPCPFHVPCVRCCFNKSTLIVWCLNRPCFPLHLQGCARLKPRVPTPFDPLLPPPAAGSVDATGISAHPGKKMNHRAQTRPTSVCIGSNVITLFVPIPIQRYTPPLFLHSVVCLIITIVVVCNYVSECTVGVDVGDGTTTPLLSIPSNIIMGCIVLGRQMNVHFDTIACINAITFVGMDVRFYTMKIHDSTIICNQTMSSIVVHLAIVQSCFCTCITTGHPILKILHKFRLCCCNIGTITHIHPNTPTLFDNTLQHVNIGLTPRQQQTSPRSSSQYTTPKP
jgi:hypothetical protein